MMLKIQYVGMPISAFCFSGSSYCKAFHLTTLEALQTCF